MLKSWNQLDMLTSVLDTVVIRGLGYHFGNGGMED